MTRKDAHPDDPRALVAEAYAMENLDVAEARAIFFDWAIGLPEGAEPGPAAARLLAHHGEAPADHPMTELLRAAVSGDARPSRPRRRRPAASED